MSAKTAFNANSLPCKSEVNATRIQAPRAQYTDRAGELVNAASCTLGGAICNATNYAADFDLGFFSARNSPPCREPGAPNPATHPTARKISRHTATPSDHGTVNVAARRGSDEGINRQNARTPE